MIFIDSLKGSNKRELLLTQVLPALVVCVALIGLTILLWQTARDEIKRDQQTTLEQVNTNTAEELVKRINIYEDVLRGGVGLYNSVGMPSRAQWNSYVDSFDIFKRYPGIQAIGYAEVVKQPTIQQHVNEVRNSGYETYDVTPKGNRELYTPIVYIEPFSGDNLSAVGFDMYSDNTRKAAMDRARDTGEPALTTLVSLVQDVNLGNTDKQPGFLLYVPIYSTPNPKSEQERRNSIAGYAYAAFRVHDLIKNVVQEENPDYVFKITYNNNGTKRILYESPRYDAIAKNKDTAFATKAVNFDGPDWKLYGAATAELANEQLRIRSVATLLTGIVFSVLFAGFIFLLLSNRAAILKRKRDKSLQNAKNELVSLASHQLRTPATGVKQYLGILQSGMVGTLGKEQLRIVNKAYDSNERQLHTINEMLAVAKADVGQLNLNARKVNYNKFVQSIVEEMKLAGIYKGQKILYQPLPKDMYGMVDERYMRMAIENLISNASKYSGEKGVITVALSSRRMSISVAITDNGVGVADNDKAHLFRKFSRIPNIYTNQVVGSGLGLYLAKKISLAHGGSIHFDSEVGKGSTVTIKIPKKQ